MIYSCLCVVITQSLLPRYCHLLPRYFQTEYGTPGRRHGMPGGRVRLMLQKKASFHPFLPLIPKIIWNFGITIPKISINFGIRIFCRTIASSFLPSPKGANKGATLDVVRHFVPTNMSTYAREHEQPCPGTRVLLTGNPG